MSVSQDTIQGFPPISRPDAHTLILGSMPSAESLRVGQYYAHPRNSFWPIIADLLSLEESDYASRVRATVAAGLAVWDVMDACSRHSSLDADIVDTTIVANDFGRFFADHPRIRRVFFNGAKSESVYCRKVLPRLQETWRDIQRQRLPSTSPAHAAMTFEDKKRAWGVIVAGQEVI